MAIITQIELLKKRRTKIVATLGPASHDTGMIKNLMAAGVNVFRLNMSHGDHDSHKAVYKHIRTLSRELDLPVAVLVDLCGPKIRTGKFDGDQITLEAGSSIIVTTRNIVGRPGLIPSQYTALANDVRPGARILLNDGALELQVNEIKETEINCTVIHGGILKNHKGINLPGVAVSAPSLTDKDKEDALFALELGADFLALSFVRRASDITELKSIIQSRSSHAAVVAKIEKPEALENADEILEVTDAIMVARGDLGVELLPEEVPVAQSQLIARARRKFKPVIVATQMLESMIENARPTRAEVTDIAHAVTLGTDAVMLSAETASGNYPLEAVKMMDRIARQTESHMWKNNAYGHPIQPDSRPPLAIWNVIANATALMSKDLMAHAVLVISNSGMSAATMSSARPAAPVIAISNNPAACRKMSLLWSVIPVLAEEAGSSNPNELARRIAKDLGLAQTGEHVLLVRGFHSEAHLNTPSITALTV